mmetsp:Transcript_18687/g.61631  ORF Transcript_18687/g.61631 Transcript_18687/m.61631 type:complete len:831 (-) Transcript_18687:208-2700(-)
MARAASSLHCRLEPSVSVCPGQLTCRTQSGVFCSAYNLTKPNILARSLAASYVDKSVVIVGTRLIPELKKLHHKVGVVKSWDEATFTYQVEMAGPGTRGMGTVNISATHVKLYRTQQPAKSEWDLAVEKQYKIVVRVEQDSLRQEQRLIRQAPQLAPLVARMPTASWSAAASQRRGGAWHKRNGFVVTPWSKGHYVPAYAADVLPPQVQLNRRTRPGEPMDKRAPVLPTLFMPGFPKCATTWLYECMLRVFNPNAVGCGDAAKGWTSKTCGRRFTLAAQSSNAVGDIRARKELFFYGGSGFNYHHPDLLNLHGPDPRGPQAAGPLSKLPALWMWEDLQTRRREGIKEHRFTIRNAFAETRREAIVRTAAMCADTGAMPQACPAGGGGGEVSSAAVPFGRGGWAKLSCGKPRCMAQMGTATCEKPNWQRHRCSGIGAPQPRDAGPCAHPACARVADKTAAYMEQFTWCSWQNRVASYAQGRSDAYCLHTLLPWATEGELNVSVVDFTPNYLCDADAMQRIRHSTTRPELLRFIVLMRDPIMRAFSEWSMFSLGWNWDRVKEFPASMAYNLKKLQKCNATLYGNVTLLRSLPTEELSAYMRQCFGKGMATQYTPTSLYVVCVKHALSLFNRSQFLFLRYEDVMHMDTAAVVRLVARFTGLHLDGRNMNIARASGQCEARRGKRKPNSYSNIAVDSAEQLANASVYLERFFDPYNKYLAELVHPAFRWTKRDHFKRPLNGTERAKAIIERDNYKESLRRRRARVQVGQKKQAQLNREAEQQRAQRSSVMSKSWGRSKGGGRGGKGSGRGGSRGGGRGAARRLRRLGKDRGAPS